MSEQQQSVNTCSVLVKGEQRSLVHTGGCRTTALFLLQRNVMLSPISQEMSLIYRVKNSFSIAIVLKERVSATLDIVSEQ